MSVSVGTLVSWFVNRVTEWENVSERGDSLVRRRKHVIGVVETTQLSFGIMLSLCRNCC